MDRVVVTTPLGPLTIEHQGTVVTVKGEELPLDWWQLRVQQGIFGAQGHVFHPGDCDLCDVIAAATSLVGPENVAASKAARARATAQLNTTPEGAIP
jgi:hypothetical protein